MTSIKEVEKELETFIGSHGKNVDKTVSEWLHNDLIKMNLAKSYDDWMSDVDDHKLPLTLKEHIETCINEPGYIGIFEEPGN